jgi:5-methylcytosine-specific restriction endonuclease McrA
VHRGDWTHCPRGHELPPAEPGKQRRCKPCQHAAQKRWRETNRDHSRAQIAAWNEAHPDSVRDRARRYRERHPERVKATQDRHARTPYRRLSAANRAAARRARCAEVIDRMLVFLIDHGRCGICGQACDPEDFHVDHVWPLARGGPHVLWNLQPTHPTCNLRRGVH